MAGMLELHRSWREKYAYEPGEISIACIEQEFNWSAVESLLGMNWMTPIAYS